MCVRILCVGWEYLMVALGPCFRLMCDGIVVVFRERHSDADA